jgi:4-hydroxythreonine-4-phosphate dehydrogenase
MILFGEGVTTSPDHAAAPRRASDMTETSPRIALMLGDCTGIGPELSARVLHGRILGDSARLVVVGDMRVLEQGMRDAKLTFPVKRVTSIGAIDWADEAVPVIDLQNIDPKTLPRAKVSAESGRLTGETLAYAIGLASRGEIDAITFAPLNKAALHAGGWRYPDEHKMFAHLLQHQGYFSEMNVLGNQWMARVTSHVSLREALDLITAHSIEDAIRLSDQTMRRAGIAAPRIAVAALNPHGGEGGLFGREEIDIIKPAIDHAVADGLSVDGPFGADTMFQMPGFDAFVVMLHDQGHVAAKLLAEHAAAALAIGTPILFSSVAHGSAHDIAGKGVADATAMIEAILRMAGARR